MSEPIKMTLKQAREIKKLTQDEAARLIGISADTLQLRKGEKLSGHSGIKEN